MLRKKKKDDANDNEPPDKCIFCQKSFSSSSAANNHMNRKVCAEAKGIQTQDTGPSLTCTECGAGPYSRARDLTRHVRYINIIQPLFSQQVSLKPLRLKVIPPHFLIHLAVL